MTDVVAIAAGTTFTKGANVTRTKIELVSHETPATSQPCVVNDTFYCADHSLLKSMGTTFEWMDASFVEIADDMIRSMGILQEAATICGVVTAAVTGIVAWANKAIVFLTSFSKFECILDKFLNIPFTILNMIDGCVAKMVGIAFGVLDALLAPFFSCVSSITSMLSGINGLISTVKGIPDRIANMANGCYLRILDTAQLLARKVAFTLDLKSRVEIQLNQRIMSVNGAIADLSNSSKMVLRNCGVVTSPTSGNTIPLFKVETNSFLDMSRIKFLNTAHAPLFKVESGGRIKIAAQKVESTAPPNTAPLVIADKGHVEVNFEEVTSENTLLSGKDSYFVYDKLGNVNLRGQNAYVGDFDNCMA